MQLHKKYQKNYGKTEEVIHWLSHGEKAVDIRVSVKWECKILTSIRRLQI